MNKLEKKNAKKNDRHYKYSKCEEYDHYDD